MKKVTLLQLVAAAILYSFSYGQQALKVGQYFTDSPVYVADQETGPQYIHATKSRKITIDLESLKPQLRQSNHRNTPNDGVKVFMMIPDPDGGQRRYEVLENTTMSEGLKRTFTEIRTYDVIAEDDKNVHGKIDFTEQGFHAMITIPGEGKFFIDPVYIGNDEYHMIYWKKDFFTSKTMVCEFEGNANYEDLDPAANSSRQFGDCQLRTYRTVVCATGEYTAFHGGTVGAAASAQVTTMNRVNEVYERDMAITLELVANNNNVIYTNAGTDPFTNGNPGAMINESQNTCNSVIGATNYDIGHVFGTNSGGLAGLGVICNNSQKGRGVTGSGAPVGDPFDIDYVAHEMGHQFGCNHTFNNSCGGNRNNGTAVEPGSGSTIMAYAGICNPNVQNNSDDHFHGISLEEMDARISTTTCPTVTALTNNPPIISATTSNFYVPANTPFALTCTASDPDGNTLLYCWEQMDTDISTQPPNASSTSGPNYRSNSPNTSPTRYFPDLVYVNAGNLTPTWEVTPSVSRTFEFRVTVRDQAAGGGCTDHADITMDTDGTSGPFVLTYPSATGITWGGLTNETVTWNVANTDNALVNCQFVDIFLSTDNGVTYPTQLADDVPNNGSYTITVPNTPSTTCRVMVMAQNGTFFDVSNNNFTITAATNDYTLSCAAPTQSVCQGSDATYTIDVGNIGGFNDPVTLTVNGVPAPANSNFSVSPVTPAGTSVLTISNTGGVTPGTYNLTVEGNSTTGTKTTPITLIVSSSSVSAVTLNFPADGATGVNVPANLQWSDAGVGAMYDLEVATDAAFTNIVSSQTGLTTNSYSQGGLASSTMHYWRVTAYNTCSTAPVSSTFSFETGGCNTIASADVPVTISASGSPAQYTSTITVTGATGVITDLNVLNIAGTHDWVQDLVFTLESPQGTTVELVNLNQVCGNQDDFDFNLDDAGTPGPLPCPPVGGNTYQPDNALSAFNGEDPNGTWTLTIQDTWDPDGGQLDSWSLEMCLAVCNQADAPTISATQTTVCSGDQVTLSIASGNLNDATDWEWYSNSCGGTPVGTGTAIAVNPTNQTDYFARGEGGCTGTNGTCGSITIDVNQPYFANTSANICNGDTYTFPDGTTSTTTTTHQSVLTDQYGCDSTINTNLTVITLNDVVSVSGSTITADEGNNATYQWIDCNNGNQPINGETNQSFTATSDGSYAVIVTSTINTQCEVTTACETITNVGLDENDANNVVVYPNPSDGNYRVLFTGMNIYQDLEVVDERGRIVFQKQMNGELEFEIDLTNYSEGIYIMKMRHADDVKIVKLIKQ